MVQQQATLDTTYAFKEIGEAIENLRTMHDQIIGRASQFGAASTFVSPMDVRSALDDLCIDLGIVRGTLHPELTKLYRQTAERDKFTLEEVINTFNKARGIPRPEPGPAYSPFVDGGE